MILRKIFKVLILLTSLFGTNLTQKPNCANSNSFNALASTYDPISNFQSGFAILENKQKNARYNYYNISLVTYFNTSYDLAISIENIQSFLPTKNLDFFINAIKRPTLLEIFFIIDTTIQWVNARIYFLVSSRPDFAVGTFVSNNAVFFQKPCKNCTQKIHYHLPHSINGSSQYMYSIPFISGLRTYDLSMNLTFKSTVYNSTTNILYIQLIADYVKFPLESLYLSYLIFNMASDLQITSFSKLASSPNNNLNIFIGVSRIYPFNKTLLNMSSSHKIGLGSSADNEKNFDMIFGINGIIIQTQQSLDLLFRPYSSSLTNYSSLDCVSKRKCNSLDGVMIYDQNQVFNIDSKCLVCMQNSFYNQTSNQCQCFRGYKQNNNSCIKISLTCEQNSTYDVKSQTCKCNILYANLSNKCVSIYSICKKGQIYFDNKCIRIVFSNAATANCSSDSLFLNKTCIKKKQCSAPFLLNYNTNNCVCPSNMQLKGNSCVLCGVNETIIDSICQCKPGYFKIGGKCLACNVNAFYNGITCVCFRYYTGDGFKCVKNGVTNGQLAKQYAPKGIYNENGGAITIN